MCGGRCAAVGARGRRCVDEGALRWGRAYGCGRAKVRRRGGGGAEMWGGRCAAEGACVWMWEGANTLKRGRGCGDVWGKVRYGGGAGAEMCGGRCAAVGARVWRCVEEGAQRWGRAYGCGWAQVRKSGGEGAMRWGRGMGVEGRKFVGARAKVRCGGGVRMGVGGRKFVGAGRKVRCGGRVRMGVGGHKFVGAGAKVRRCVEEGAMRWGRAYGCRWAKVRRRGAGVRCGGSVRMGVEGRKFVGAGAGVRRCVEEGALRRGRAYGCGRAQVRRRGAGVRCVGGIGAEECGERCAAVGRFLSRNKGKVGGDGRIAIDKMARRCATEGA